MVLLNRAFPDSVVYHDIIPAGIATVFLFFCFTNIAVAHYKDIKELSNSSLYFLLTILVTFSIISVRLLPIDLAGLGIVVSIGISLSLLSPSCAVNVFVSFLLIRPWELGEQSALLLLIPKLCAGISMASWLLRALVIQKLTIHWCRPATFFVGWIGWIAADTLLQSGDFQSIVENFFPTVTVAFLLYNTPQRLLDLALVRSTILTSIVGVLANAYYLTLTHSSLDHGGRLETVGYWSNSNDLGALISVALPIVATTFFMGRSERFEGSKPTAFVILILFLIAIWHTQSRATLLGAGISLALAGALAIDKRYLLLKLCIGAGLIIGALGAMVAVSRDESDLEGSSVSRKAMIIAGLKMTRHAPILGVGFLQFPKRFDDFATSYIETGERTAHNSWILAMGETGLPGFALFTSLMLSVLYYSWRIREQYPVLFVTFASYLFTMTFLSHTYLFLPYLLAGWVLGGVRVVAKNYSQT